MKTQFLLLAFLAYLGGLFAQHTEFTVYPNGLMYSDTTMRHLKNIVDSLNLKFKTCDLSKTYYAKQQAEANYIILKKEQVFQARKDMKNKISFEDFKKKYPNAIINNNLLITKWLNDEHTDELVTEFVDINSSMSIIAEEKNAYAQPRKNTWIFEYHEQQGDFPASIYAFYFLDEFKSKPLAKPYAKMVQYVDCMVDTATEVFTEKAFDNYTSYAERTKVDSLQKIQYYNFFNYVEKHQPAEPPYTRGTAWGEYQKKYNVWDSIRIAFIKDTLSQKEEFKQLLANAAQEAVTNGNSNDRLEWYIAEFYSKKIALELKRGRIVVGSCSQDASPRYHTLNIAILSAETANWNVFLRAHLNIMNDQFQRMSDGSYAWEQRQTYIRELEELGINVLDLLIGSCLRIENANENHYFGDIQRVGRALAESKQSSEVETRLLAMIEDGNLDDVNRLLMASLYINYNYYIKDEQQQKASLDKLKAVVKKLPPYLSQKINFED